MRIVDHSMRAYSKSVGLIALGVGLALSRVAGGAERFGFVIPGNDSAHTFTDLSNMNTRPAGADGFVRIKDGKFYTNSARLKITNENAFSSKGPGIATSLPEPYRGEFKRQWNQWLKRQYRSTAALKRAWRDTGEPLRNVSEWNIPSPSDYAASVVPFAALVAGLQDWDGVFFFQYHISSDHWDTDQLQSYFSFNGHPAKLALFTACAHLYRRNDLAPLPQTLAGTTKTMMPAGLGLDYQIGIDPHASEAPLAQAPQQAPLGSLRGPAYWDARDKDKAYVHINSPKSRAVWGRIAQRTFTLESLGITVGHTLRDYAAIVMTSMDDRPLEQSRSLLLTAVGSAENRNMGWNAERSSVGSEWGTGPTQCNGIPASIQLANPHIKQVHALDGTGKRTQQVELTGSGTNGLSFDISSGYQTLWYELSE